MRSMMRCSVRLAWVLSAALFLSAIVRAQDPPPPPPQPENQGTDQNPNTPAAQSSDQNVTTPTPNPGSPIDTQIHAAGKAVPWLGTTSPLRWGPFSVGFFSYEHINDHFQPEGNVPSANIELSILRTSIVFEEYFRKQRIVLQYEPQLAILNGKLATNAGLNNSVTLGTAFHLSPRLDLTLNDTFAEVRSRQFFPPNVLGVDEQAGNLIQNNFLQNAGSFLMNEVGGTLTYAFTPRTLLTVSSAYRYAYDTDNNPNLPNYAANGHTIVATTAVTRALTPRQNLGVLYTLEVLRAANVAGIANNTNTLFHVVEVFYANQLSQTWWLRGQFGVQYADYRGNGANFVTVAGGATLVKTFTHSSFALAYNRGRTATNFVTPRFGDRADINYSIHLTRRLVWNSGVGYYAETGANPRTRGNYGDTGVALEIAPTLFLDGSYNHTFQKASTQQLLSGIRNTYIVGLRWEPRPLPGH